MNIEGGSLNPLQQRNFDKTQMEIKEMLQLLLNQRGYNATGSFWRTGPGGMLDGDGYSNELVE